MLHQTSLLSLAAAAVLLSNGASADSGVRPHHARSRAAHVVARSNTMPDGWSLTAACLTDAAVPNRLLKQSTNFMDTLTPALCASTCAADGFVYAAVQDGHECWCGSTLNKSATTGVKADVSQCNWACPGDASQTCGGYYHLTLYSSISSGNIYSSYSHKLHSSTVKSSETHSATESINPSSSVAHVASTTTKSATTSTPSVGTSKYKLVENISGSSFFSHFDFFTAADPTNGLVTFVSSSVANSSGLVEYKDGQAIMRVDATTQLGANQNRKSVRVTSKNAYKTGLMVFDVAAMPYGCAVWPAMWTVGPNWPNGAEIDIIEGVNNAKVNQLTLHTGESTSCSTSAVSTEAVSTNFMNKQCASSETADAGCVTRIPPQARTALGSTPPVAQSTLSSSTPTPVPPSGCSPATRAFPRTSPPANRTRPPAHGVRLPPAGRAAPDARRAM